MNPRRSAGLWALVLGATGFAAGFFGPMVLTPDANQGPLFGIFLSGPGGAAAGALLGFLVGLTPLSVARSRALLAAVGACYAVAVLFFCLPEPRFDARLLDAEILGCSSPSTLKEAVISNWENRVAAVTWAPPRAGWKEDFDRMVAADPGSILLLRERRQRNLFINRKPWNKGSISARAWTPGGPDRTYFARGACAAFPAGARAVYLVSGETAKQWPPEILPNLLNLETVGPLPADDAPFAAP